MRFMNLMILFPLVASLVACHKDRPDEIEPAKPIVLTEQQSYILTDANTFAFDLYKEMELDNPGKSRMISPLSASLALSLLSTGARSQTADEIISALGFDCSAEEMSAFYRHLMTQLLKVDPSTTLESANSVWANKFIELQKSFVRSSEKYFDAEVRSVDFTDPKTTAAINSWCSDKTHGRIKSIVDSMDPQTLVAILNALYFNGKWSKEFKTSHKDVFRCSDGSSKEVEMMTRKLNCKYNEDASFRMVEIPYGNGAFAMDIVLPVKDDPEKFNEEVRKMSALEWYSLTAMLGHESVSVELPAFKMECEYDFIPYLKKLGISKAFTTDADFSGISETPSYVSQIIQKTYIDVNKKGTEAAAVTMIANKMTSAGPDMDILFRVDRPFIFAIREVSTGAILFIGQKAD